MPAPEVPENGPRQGSASAARGIRSPSFQYQVAKRYYIGNATQDELARLFGLSRATISRVLAQARASGIVHIEVREPDREWSASASDELREALGLRAAYVEPPVDGRPGPVLALGVQRALREVGLDPGDALLVSSGTTMLEISREDFPSLPSVLVAPMIGGQQEQDAEYQTNEIARAVANRCGGTVALLHAPAQPAAGLYDSLIQDPSVRRVVRLWKTAKCALMGIGAPAQMRSVMPATMSHDLNAIRASVGDICHRPFDKTGAPISFSGTMRLLSTTLEDLRRIPFSIAVAVGAAKVTGLVTAARAGYYNTLVTDAPTAQAILRQVRPDS